METWNEGEKGLGSQSDQILLEADTSLPSVEARGQIRKQRSQDVDIPGQPHGASCSDTTALNIQTSRATSGIQCDSEVRSEGPLDKSKPVPSVLARESASASAGHGNSPSAPEDVQLKLQELREEAKDILRCSWQFCEDLREGRLSPENILNPNEALLQREKMWKLNTRFLRDGVIHDVELKMNEEREQRCLETRRLNLNALKHCEEAGNLCSSCLALEAFNDTISTDYESDVNKLVIANATKIVKHFFDGDFNSIELKGSTTNNLKVGRVDELDFLVTLEDEVLREEDGWQLVSDTPDVSVEIGRDTWSTVNLESAWQVRRVDKDRHGASAKQPNKSGYKYLIAYKIKQEFEEELIHALSDIVYHPEGVERFTAQHRLVWKGDSGIIYFSPNLHYSVKLDITPCVPFLRSDGNIDKLVPNRTFNHWRLVNSDTPEIHNSIVSQAIRILKGLRDCSANPYIDAKYFSTRVYDVIAKDTEEYHRLGRVSQLITTYCGLAEIAPQTTNTLSSYAIMGTVVKRYRQNPGQPLCSLVVDSLINFEHISPSGKLLSQSKFSPVVLFTETFLFDLCSTLRTIIDAASKPGESLKTVIPIFYGLSLTDLENELKQTTSDQKDVFKFSAAKQKRTQGQTTPVKRDRSGAMSWGRKPGFSEYMEKQFSVYLVSITLFTSFFLRRTALGEKELQGALQELQDTHQNQDLYVAVRTVSSGPRDNVFSNVDASCNYSSPLLEDLLKSLCSDRLKVWKTISI